EAQGHVLQVEMPENTPWLNADPVRISQIIANLLNNAAKYTPPGGSIRLNVENGPSEVTLRVSDTGIGIPAAALRTIFEPFTQIDNSLERSKGGLGIGLALVKKLVDLHGGAIEVLSEGEGRGSEFVVRLPCIDPPQSFASPTIAATDTATEALR